MRVKRITLRSYIVDSNINNKINELLLKYKGYKVYSNVFAYEKDYINSEKVHVYAKRWKGENIGLITEKICTLYKANNY